MIYDCFTFNGEIDVLDIRFNELYDVIDRFIVLEGSRTFQGQDKPLVWPQVSERWSAFLDKIAYLSFVPGGGSTWEREEYSRNYVGYGLDKMKVDDIIMMSDADEIPRASVVETLDPQQTTILNMDEYYYSLNLWTANYGFTRACYYRDFPGGNNLRRAWDNGMPVIENAGWHFSYLMDAETISNKIKSFSHEELNTPEYTDVEKIAGRMRAGQDLYDRGILERREISDHPRFVLDNLDYFRKFIL